MPLNNNTQALNAYDRAQAIPIPTLAVDPLNELAVQCLSFEVLRGWFSTGLTVDQYNAMPDAEWETLRASLHAAALSRTTLNPASAQRAALLSAQEKEIAGIQGDNYFEHGYVYIMSGVDPSQKKTLLRDTGVQ